MRPASLDGSLLARKGDAAPAIANDSPLLEELGEPRPNQPDGRLGKKNSVARSRGSVLVLIGHGLAWLAVRPVFGVLALAIGIAILFAVTIAALTPSPDGVSAPAPSEPVASVAEPEKIILPTDGKSMTEPSDPVMEAATKPPEFAVVVPPDPPATIVAPEPPAKVVAVAPPAKRAVAATPSRRSVRSGRYLLQLSAVPTAKSARTELARLEKRLGRLLGKRKIIIVKAAPPGKPPVYRLRASAYDSRAAARAACDRIRKRKMACIVVRR